MGRPGWHIECSAMAGALLGETFDIHGGGIDLVFPHHENEIAQSRSAHGTPLMARYWMHNGFLQVEGEKMSKSLGNFVTIHDLLETNAFGGRAWPGEVIRLAMMKTHYRQPIDWTVSALEEARDTLGNWAELAERHTTSVGSDTYEPPVEIVEVLSDDLNSPAMLAEMHGYARAARRGDFQRAQDLTNSAHFLGLNPKGWFGQKSRESISHAALEISGGAKHVDTLVAARSHARSKKDFAEADRIRNELEKMGILLKDSRDPKTGEIKTDWELRR